MVEDLLSGIEFAVMEDLLSGIGFVFMEEDLLSEGTWKMLTSGLLLFRDEFVVMLENLSTRD